MENNLKAVVNKIEQISRAVDPTIGDFLFGDIYSINHLQDIKYPAIVVTNSSHTANTESVTYGFNIFYIDRLTDSKENKLDVQSAAINTLSTAVLLIDDEYILREEYQINTFEEKFNDVCAGAYAGIKIQMAIDTCGVELPSYYSLTKVADYLYKGTWESLDYSYANTYFKSNTPSLVGACSSIRVGNYYGRNFDWKYDELINVVLDTGYTLGVCGGLEGFTEDVIGKTSDLYKILPFFLQDGINKDGLVMSLNIVPKDKGDNSVVNKSGKKDVCSIMLVRYILDRCKTVDEAINELYKIKVFTPAALNYDLHYMIADSNKTVVVEFINGEYNILEHNKLTNFHISGVNFLDNGKVFTQYQISGDNKPSKYGITPYASGLERYNLMVDAEGDMQQLMKSLLYTNAYSKPFGDEFWYSEYVGGQFITDTLTTDASYKSFINSKREEFNNRQRDGKTWQTTHSSVYSFSNKKLRITSQEDDEVYEFLLWRTYPLIEMSVTLNQSATINTPEDYYGISKINVTVPESVDAYTKAESDARFTNKAYQDEFNQAVFTNLGEIDLTLEDKQDTLVSGSNIKTINGESVLGSGDIVVGGGGDWELLIDNTTSEEIASWSFSHGDNGQVFNDYKEIAVYFQSQPAAKSAYIRLVWTSANVWSDKPYLGFTSTSTTVTTQGLAIIQKTPIGILPKVHFKSYNNSTLSGDLGTTAGSNLNMITLKPSNQQSSVYPFNYEINYITLGSYQAVIGAGSRIIVIGKK